MRAPGRARGGGARADDGAGGKRLVAYVVGEALQSGGAARRTCRGSCRSTWCRGVRAAGGVPLTPNGKLDRRALPAPDADAYARARSTRPRWASGRGARGDLGGAARVERVGRGDDFFTLGGHSLLAVQMIVAGAAGDGGRASAGRRVREARALRARRPDPGPAARPVRPRNPLHGSRSSFASPARRPRRPWRSRNEDVRARAGERALCGCWRSGADTEPAEPGESCVHALFEAQVARAPGAAGRGLRR